MRIVLLFILALLAMTAGASVDSTRFFTPGQIRGLRIWGSNGGLNGQGGHGMLNWDVALAFKNETKFELSEVDVKLSVTENGQEVYGSRIVPIKNFVNIGFYTIGSLLPYNKTANTSPVHFLLPADVWTTAVRVNVIITGARAFAGDVDLHDLHHLYSRFLCSDANEPLRLMKLDPTLLKVRNSEGIDTTCVAMATSTTDVIKYVVAHGGTWKPRTKAGTTSMHFAAINAAPGALDLILAHGGDVNAFTNRGASPLYKAIRFGYPQNVQWLLKHGANPNAVSPLDKSVPVQWAILDGQVQALKDLAAGGADMHHRAADSASFMHVAVNNYLMMPQLASLGVAVDDVDPKYHYTPLMEAARVGNLDAAQWLLQHGANPNRKDIHGKNAFDYAKQSNTLNTDRWFRETVDAVRHKNGL